MIKINKLAYLCTALTALSFINSYEAIATNTSHNPGPYDGFIDQSFSNNEEQIIEEVADSDANVKNDAAQQMRDLYTKTLGASAPTELSIADLHEVSAQIEKKITDGNLTPEQSQEANDDRNKLFAAMRQLEDQKNTQLNSEPNVIESAKIKPSTPAKKETKIYDPEQARIIYKEVYGVGAPLDMNGVEINQLISSIKNEGIYTETPGYVFDKTKVEDLLNQAIELQKSLGEEHNKFQKNSGELTKEQSVILRNILLDKKLNQEERLQKFQQLLFQVNMESPTKENRNFAYKLEREMIPLMAKVKMQPLDTSPGMQPTFAPPRQEKVKSESGTNESENNNSTNIPPVTPKNSVSKKANITYTSQGKTQYSIKATEQKMLMLDLGSSNSALDR